MVQLYHVGQVERQPCLDSRDAKRMWIVKRWKIRYCQRIDGVANRGECIVVARMVRDALAEFDRKGFVNASVIAVWQMVEGE